MEVSWLGPRSAGAGASVTAGLVLPDLLKLTTVSPQAQALREQRDEKDDRRRRERESQDSATAVTQNPTQMIRDAERDMTPGSRAAQRQAQAERDQGAAVQRQTFQRTLADASARQNARVAPASKSVASSGAAATDGGQPANGAASTDTTSSSVPANPEGKAGSTARALTNASANAPAAPGSATHVNASAVLASAAAAPVAQAASAVRATAAAQAVEGPGAARATAGQAAAPSAATVAKGAAGPVAAPTAPAVVARTTVVKADGPTARATAPETAETGKSDANVEQIVRVLRSQISADRAQATLRLDPPELGTIKLHMDLRNDALSLRVDTQTTAAHHLLSEQIDSLRDGLAASGIQLEHVEIRPPVPQPDAGVPTPGYQPDTSPGWQDGTSHANAEHSSRQGTESSGAPQAVTAARDAIPEPAAESLVNILA